MKLSNIVLSTILVFLFIGCSSSTPSPYSINVQKNNGAIIIYRPDNNIWRYKRFNIYINDKYVDMLRNKSHFIYKTNPGKYTVELKEDIDLNPNNYKVIISLNKGKVKYVRLGTDSIEGHLKLKKVRKNTAISDEWNKKKY